MGGLRVFLSTATLLFVCLQGTAVASELCISARIHRDAAARAGHGHRWAVEAREGRKAASEYDRCARNASGPEYERLIFEKARSFMLGAAGSLGTAGDAAALPAFNVARTLFAHVSVAPLAPDDLRLKASARRRLIESAYPDLRHLPMAYAVLPRANIQSEIQPFNTPPPLTSRTEGVATTQPTRVAERPLQAYGSEQASQQPAIDVRILAAWSSPGREGNTFLHVRVNITAQRAIDVRSGDFRVTALSTSGGRETVYGMTGPTPSFTRTDYLSSTATPVLQPLVSRSEDLGFLGNVHLELGDSTAKVITFLIRSEADAGSTAQTISYVPRGGVTR